MDAWGKVWRWKLKEIQERKRSTETVTMGVGTYNRWLQRMTPSGSSLSSLYSRSHAMILRLYWLESCFSCSLALKSKGKSNLMFSPLYPPLLSVQRTSPTQMQRGPGQGAAAPPPSCGPSSTGYLAALSSLGRPPPGTSGLKRKIEWTVTVRSSAKDSTLVKSVMVPITILMERSRLIMAQGKCMWTINTGVSGQIAHLPGGEVALVFLSK